MTIERLVSNQTTTSLYQIKAQGTRPTCCSATLLLKLPGSAVAKTRRTNKALKQLLKLFISKFHARNPKFKHMQKHKLIPNRNAEKRSTRIIKCSNTVQVTRI